MKLPKYRPTKTLLLVVVLATLLGTLATLQYRWLGQVSTGERERMHASLEAGTRQFSQDFNREITRAYLSFQMDAATLRDEKTDELRIRFEQWDAKAPYPKLVTDLYLLDKERGSLARFRYFNRTSGAFEHTDWPGEFDGLRSKLVTSGPVSYVNDPDFLDGFMVNPIDPNVPALILPILVAPRVVLADGNETHVDSNVEKSVTTGQSPLVGYLIIKLNREVITNDLIPALAQRYFSGSKGLEYNLAVINIQNPDKPVYLSDPTLVPRQSMSGDATARLMDIQPDQLDALWFGLPRKSIAGDGNGPKFERKLPEDDVVVRTDSQSQKGSTNSRSVTVRVFNRNTKEFASLDKTVDGGPWQLLIQHRAGSLEAAVTTARRRNLAISFGVLLLLAGSVAMIVLSTRRAELLANRQMDFVSAVSHEFRTPLSVICSAGENLADGVIDGTPQTRKYGELVRNEGRRLSEMVEQVLEFAGARSRRLAYQFRPIDIGSVIADALTSYQPVIEEKGYTVQQEIASGLPLVAADGAALRRSLQNLLSNAMKYESDSRWIKIRAQTGEKTNGDEVQVSVEDHGIGIAADEVSHIFEPFYRGRDVVDAQIHGNGLGLSLVKQVIEAHSGSISVESVQGKGSTFTLHLPAIDQKLVQAESDTSSI